MTERDSQEELHRLRNRTAELERENVELKKAVADQQALLGILTVCAHCKQVRDPEGPWVGLDSYLSDHLGVEYSHSLCPTCAPDFGFTES